MTEIDTGGWVLMTLGVCGLMCSIFLPLTPFKALMSFQPGFGFVQCMGSLVSIFIIWLGWRLAR